MKKLMSIILAVLMLMASLSSVTFADKQNPLNSYDFNNQTADGITSSSNANYFSLGFEAGIDDKAADDYAYKLTATTHGSTSGSKYYDLIIPTKAPASDNIVVTEFEMYPSITYKSGAKDSQKPNITIKSSGKVVAYIYVDKIAHSELGGWSAIISEPAAYMNKWSDFKLVVYKEDNTFDLYFNGAKIISKLSLGTTADTSTISVGWSYWYDAPGDNCYFALDNVTSYCVSEIKEPAFKAPSAAGYAVDNTGCVITVPAYATGADLIANVLPDDGCSVRLIDVLGNTFDSSRQISRNTKAVISNDNSSATYTINVSNQIANDDFDSWTLSAIDISDGTAGGTLTTGTDTIKWRDWNANANGSIAIESEDGRGKVLRITSDESHSQTDYSGQSVNLIAYTGADCLIKAPTVDKTWVFSCDIKGDTLSNPAGLLFVDNSGDYIDCIRLGYDGIANEAQLIGKLYNDKWYNCATVIDTKKGIYTTYIDGILAGSKEITPTRSGISQIRLYVNKVKGVNQSVWFDNFSIYEFDNTSDYNASAFSTQITSNNKDVVIGKGSLKNIITLTSAVTADALESSLESDSGAEIKVLGVNAGDKVTVKSKNGKNTAEYVIANENGIADFDFTAAVDSNSVGYISADCEYAGAQKPMIVAALYNGNNLVKLGSVGEDLSSQDYEGYLSGGVNIESEDEWTDLKIMIFESAQNLKPLAQYKYIQK